ncbi:MAG: hypothetical protein ACPGUZ_04070 [Holosporaceae bacterium]
MLFFSSYPLAVFGHQDPIKGPAAPYMISGTQNAVAKTLHAKSGDPETIDAEKANIKGKSVHPHNALHTHPEDAAGKMSATETITVADPMINGHQKVTADPLNHNTMIKGTITAQGKRHAGKTDALHIGRQSTTKGMTKRIIKDVETIVPTPNEGIIGGIACKDHRQHQAVMPVDKARQKCR